MPKESGIQSRIVAYLNSLPRALFEVRGPGSPVGAPDIFGCIEGWHVEIEVKTPSKDSRLGSKQAYELARWDETGAHVLVARSVDEVKEFLWENVL